MAQLTKVRDFLIYRNERYYCGPGPSAVQLSDGRILVAFRRAYNWVPEGIWGHEHPSTEGCLTESLDGGHTWSVPRIFTAGNITNQNLTLLPDGSLLCITQRSELLPLSVYARMLKEQSNFGGRRNEDFGWATGSHGVQVMRSTDEGRSWQGPYFVSPIPDCEPLLPGWPSPAGLRSSAINLSDGTVGVSVYGFIDRHTEATSVWFMTSSDEGETWAPRGRIAHDPEGKDYFNEAGVYQCANGKLVALMRAEKAREKPLHISESTDLGSTWTPPQRQEVRGYPYQAAPMSSGNVLLAYGHRFDPLGVRARLLDAECSDPADAEELVLRDDGKTKDLGYPHVLPLQDGTALVTYYHNDARGVRFVAGSIVAERDYGPITSSGGVR